MTVEQYIEQEYGDSFFNPTGEEVIELMRKYTKLKCLETAKNVRYAAIDVVLEETLDRGLLTREIQNIDNNKILPEI